MGRDVALPALICHAWKRHRALLPHDSIRTLGARSRTQAGRAIMGERIGLLWFSEVARVLVRLDYVASSIVNVDHWTLFVEISRIHLFQMGRRRRCYRCLFLFVRIVALLFPSFRRLLSHSRRCNFPKAGERYA